MKEIALNLKSMQDYRINESYKQLRTNIEFSGEENKIIAVTSCTPSEGKSTVSLSTAYSLAEAGKKVLFIDADLRKSVLTGRYKISGEMKGLTPVSYTHLDVYKRQVRCCFYDVLKGSRGWRGRDRHRNVTVCAGNIPAGDRSHGRDIQRHAV